MKLEVGMEQLRKVILPRLPEILDEARVLFLEFATILPLGTGNLALQSLKTG